MSVNKGTWDLGGRFEKPSGERRPGVPQGITKLNTDLRYYLYQRSRLCCRKIT